MFSRTWVTATPDSRNWSCCAASFGVADQAKTILIEGEMRRRRARPPILGDLAHVRVCAHHRRHLIGDPAEFVDIGPHDAKGDRIGYERAEDELGDAHESFRCQALGHTGTKPQLKSIARLRVGCQNDDLRERRM